MDKEEVIKILENFNDWRRGLEGVECEYSPKEIGLAIDSAIYYLMDNPPKYKNKHHPTK